MDKISRKDWEIIALLEKDGRASAAEIGVKIGLSPSTVSRRIDKLLKSKTISIFPVPNPFKIGNKAKAFITLNVDRNQIYNACAAFAENLHVNLIHTNFGRSNVLMTVNFPTWEGLHDFVYSEVSTMSSVKRAEVYFVKETYKRFYGFEGSDAAVQPSALSEEDESLIKALSSDGRASYEQIARRLGTSSATVYRRLTSLVQNDFIKVKALVNLSVLGFSANAYLALHVEAAQRDHICQVLANLSEVYIVMTMVNGFGVLVGLHTDTPENLHALIQNKIAKLDGVLDVEPYVRAEILKRYYGVQLSLARRMAAQE